MKQVLGFSRQRTEPERWIAFRSHWGIESFYCRPGIEGAHEKGGVEGQIGYFRRNHFVPVPEVATLAELNEMVDQWDLQDEARRIRSRTKTVGEYFAMEQQRLKPLPIEPFETGRWFTPRVDRYGLMLTELRQLFSQFTGHVVARCSTVAARDDRRGVAAGSRVPGGSAGGLARSDRRSVGAVSPA
ncbi:hypothetical protein [Streptomyces sp. NPDC087300]|uniref:hypothetical protein n=1 Tax=Streptomyces sp. NPDC087300 TaxID=3365780 RepID=UPI00380E2A81